ncbi:MAG: hypothetical protein A3H31_04615 [Gallionellales bacterium RIFCSPLOWO2_02_FULL_57_47]|nr:MAG: hypothetical protein A3H31_04615 [Gallionellales bacterium RIFCSPLOWO2_02_FULL_57_47]OGT16503.1 MAG: hypothetical protein A3J49_17715 [Gallionellales bacterium RIFCSPHIGHO2_02_FULL_57_16]
MSAWGMHLGPLARRQVLVSIWVVILSGVLWIVIGWNLDAEDYTDPLRAWRHRVLGLHGISAYVLLWITGRLYSLHQHGNWRAQRNRASGMALSGALLLLAGSGLALYYPPHEDWRDALSIFHQVSGVVLVLLVLLHVWLAKKYRRRHNS